MTELLVRGLADIHHLSEVYGIVLLFQPQLYCFVYSSSLMQRVFCFCLVFLYINKRSNKATGCPA